MKILQKTYDPNKKETYDEDEIYSLLIGKLQRDSLTNEAIFTNIAPNEVPEYYTTFRVKPKNTNHDFDLRLGDRYEPDNKYYYTEYPINSTFFKDATDRMKIGSIYTNSIVDSYKSLIIENLIQGDSNSGFDSLILNPELKTEKETSGLTFTIDDFLTMIKDSKAKDNNLVIVNDETFQSLMLVDNPKNQYVKDSYLKNKSVNGIEIYPTNLFNDTTYKAIGLTKNSIALNITNMESEYIQTAGVAYKRVRISAFLSGALLGNKANIVLLKQKV